MPFLRKNIDRAIVMTQCDLRGFFHPLGFREPKMLCGKSLDAITANLVAAAAGLGSKDETKKPTDDAYVDYFGSSFDDYLAMCKRLAEDCDLSQKEAIQLIIQEIVKQSEEMKAEVAAGKRGVDNYLRPLEKDNRWGKAVLALTKAFESFPEQVAA